MRGYVMKDWISLYWPAVTVTAFNLLSWVATSPVPGHLVWQFYAGRALQVLVVAVTWWLCRREARRRRRLQGYLEAMRKKMAGYTGVD